MNTARFGRALAAPAVLALWFASTAFSQPAPPPTIPETKPLALVGAQIFSSPAEPAIPDGVVVVENGKVAAVGRREQVTIPEDAQVVECGGHTVVAGFWNCHVHFTEPKWQGVGELPAGQLRELLQAMLTAYGFTTVVDLGSDVANTVALRQRIESGEVAGPRIITAGLPIYPENGIPFYVTDFVPTEIVKRLFAPASPEEAVRNVEANLAAGADLIKVFLVTGVRREGRIALASMRPDFLKAVVARAHELGRPVVAHPSYVQGLELTLESGVDILAHTTQDPVNWTDEVVARLTSAKTALIPTLTLFSATREFDDIRREVKSYADAGGELLFGTDIGFLTDYADLTREYELLGRSGLRFRDILAMLTTAPSKRFDRTEQGGRIAQGAVADLVVLKGDPSTDLRAFTDVRCTIRGGRVIYRSQE